MTAPALETRDLSRTFGGGRSLWGTPRPGVRALRGVTLRLDRGETLGIVGESGCGKTTLARLVAGLDRPTHGEVRLGGKDIAPLVRHDRRTLARDIQYVFQDPISSLNPRKTVRASLEAPLTHLLGLGRPERKRRTEEIIGAVGLRPEHLERYPHEFSGGQAQRIGIARALAPNPTILVLDEPVSALDVSVQAQVLNLLSDLKERLSLTFVFISHDLSVVEAVSDRVAVMYLGKTVECAKTDDLFRFPRHPYTRLLLDSVPLPGKRRSPVTGPAAVLPDPGNPPAGCAYSSRCPRSRQRCLDAEPRLAENGAAHQVACFFPLGTGNGADGDMA